MNDYDYNSDNYNVAQGSQYGWRESLVYDEATGESFWQDAEEGPDYMTRKAMESCRWGW